MHRSKTSLLCAALTAAVLSCAIALPASAAYAVRTPGALSQVAAAATQATSATAHENTLASNGDAVAIDGSENRASKPRPSELKLAAGCDTALNCSVRISRAR